MQTRRSSKLLLFASAIVFAVLQVIAPAQAQDKKTATARLSGRVVDARTGEALAKVKVIVSGTNQETTTDDNGAFTLDNLNAGKIDLYITTVTFGLVKKTVTLKEGNNPDFQIALNEDAAALTESVTINTTPFESSGNEAISEHLLNKRELQQLSSVLLNDPIRAAQALPGEQRPAQRRVRHEAHAQPARGRDDAVLQVPAQQRVLALQRGDRVDRGRAAERVGVHLGQAEMADLARRDQLGQRADRLLDRHAGIVAVQVVEVDAVGAQPGQRRVDGAAEVVGGVVDVPPGGGAHHPALRREDHLVAAAAQGVADERLVGRLAVAG